MTETSIQFHENQGGAGSDSMKAMWGNMQNRAKARRAQSQPCGGELNSKLLRNMQDSHVSGSTSPSASGVSTPRSDVWTSDCSSVGSDCCEEGAQYVYNIPRGCRVKNGFIEFDEPNDEDIPCVDDPAAAWQPFPSAPADEPARVGMSRAGGSSRAAIPVRSRDLVEASVMDAPDSAQGSRQDASAKSRPRPSKPKRLQGKALAERLFRAQWRGIKEEIAQAREAFQEETHGDPLMQSYTLSVLRCLNVEASTRVANGEDPLLTAAHS